ncbi:ABC transporter substrate-binding protein [Oxalicibacterium faecigallinarum]|uniref:Sulfonate ABC transporter substrate-binding protein n=1 Tax=Oxalicibacterium faecigallinarum TaxID=573741 RepID=A0A8J3AVI4_9BURK|nr:ABC transporter substrate-binding protein [Oxalicibacterium faecigallinarum]GGI20870.1 sulfonate ABC transporter substrate-binding protein [Oxalicibacterium faecigallinarum]
MKKLVLTSLITGLLFSAGSASAQKMEKVTASWLPIMQTMAYYVALEEKLFEKAGIEINSVKFQNPNQIIDSLVSGQADFGPPGAAAGITALAEARYPGTFKVFGLQGGGIKVNMINDGLIVSNTSTISSFKDLKGKSIATLPGIQWKTITRYVIRQNGLDPDKDVMINEIAVPMHIPSLLAGTVDATLSLEPVGSIAIASKEAKRAMTNPVAMFIADPFYSGASVLSTKFMKERPAVAKKIVEVLDQATKMTNENFDKYRPIIAKYTAIKPDQVSLVAQPYLRANSELTATDIASYQALVNVFEKEGVLKEHVDVKKLMLKPSDFN